MNNNNNNNINNNNNNKKLKQLNYKSIIGRQGSDDEKDKF